MANSVLRKLKDELDRIERERARLEKQAESFRQVIAYYEQLDEDEDAVEKAVPAKAITNEMWQILEAEGRPLHYQHIYERLKERGIHVPGKEPARNVGAHLSADARFENVSRGMWGLRSWKGVHESAMPGSFSRSTTVQVSEAPDVDIAEAGVREDGPDAFLRSLTLRTG